MKIFAAVFGPFFLQISWSDRDLIATSTNHGIKIKPVRFPGERIIAPSTFIPEFWCTFYRWQPIFFPFARIQQLKPTEITKMRKIIIAAEECAVVNNLGIESTVRKAVVFYG